MSDFKTGGVPSPDYDSEDINYIYQKTEFTEDVFVYGDVYAQSFNSEKTAFLAELTTTQTRMGNINAFLRSFDTVRFNLGDGWDNTNGKFTAPVEGLYKFNIDMTFDNGDAASAGNTGQDDSIGVYWRVENNSKYYNRVHSDVRDFHSINPRFLSGNGLEINYCFSTLEQLDKGATVGWYQTDWDVDGVRLIYATITGYLI